MEIRKITSRANEEIKKIRSLAQRKFREETGLFITEGLRHALEAAEAGWTFEALVIEDGAKGKDLVKKLLGLGQTLPDARSPGRHHGKHHQARQCTERYRRAEAAMDGFVGGKEFAVDRTGGNPRPRQPRHHHAHRRAAVGAKGIILIENTCDPFSLEAIRASMGSFPHVKMVRCTRAEFAAWAKTSGFQIIGTHLKTDHDYRTVKYKAPVILLMGNEQAGLTDELVKSCTQLVKIPMQGKADSLNVSVATAIMLYEINRAELKINAH